MADGIAVAETRPRGLAPAAAAADAPPAGRDLAAWAWLGLAALAIAGLMAILLAVSRIPGIESVIPWPVGFFRKGLILHVVMSIVVWFAAAFAALTATCDPGPAPAPGWHSLGPIAAAVMACALPCLLLPAFLDRGEPLLNNYVPVINDPLYFAGLLMLAIAIVLAALRLLIGQAGAPPAVDPLRRMTVAAAIVFLVAMACFALAGWQLAGTPSGYWYAENLMWGGGHVMQFANVALMIAGWSALVTAAGGRPAPAGAVAVVISLLLILSVVPTLLFYAIFPPFSGAQAEAFSQLKYVAGLPAGIALLAMLAALPRPWPWSSPHHQVFGISVLLFAVGGLFGIVVDGADTRTPAHYHGMIAGVSLAAMGLFFVRFLPALGRPTPSRHAILWVAHLFGWGQLTACVGLFIAGGYGAPRKVAGDAQGLVDVGAMIGLGLNGLGGLIAVAGGIVFVISAGRALLTRPPFAASRASIPASLRIEKRDTYSQSHTDGENR